jgi:hypothetical protein
MATGIQGPQGYKGPRGLQGMTGWGAIGSETGPTGPQGGIGTFTSLVSVTTSSLQLVDSTISTLYTHNRSSGDISLQHGASAAGGFWVFYHNATSNRTLTPSTVTNPMTLNGFTSGVTLVPNKSMTIVYSSGSNYITI